MKYLQKRFSVPVAGPSVTQEAWDAIFRRAENKEGLDRTCDDQQPRAPAYECVHDPVEVYGWDYQKVGWRCRKCGLYRRETR